MLALDRYVDTDPPWRRLSHKKKLAVLRAKANFHKKTLDAQYKRHYDVKVHVKPEFVSNQWVFLDIPSLIRKFNAADKMAKNSYNKLQTQKARSFQIIKSQPLTVDLDEK